MQLNIFLLLSSGDKDIFVTVLEVRLNDLHRIRLYSAFSGPELLFIAALHCLNVTCIATIPNNFQFVQHILSSFH